MPISSFPAERKASGEGTPDAVAPPPQHPRFPLLDGMRAVAVVCVVLVHTAFFGGALSDSLPGRLLAHLNIGVTIFFLISGFLLYRPFIAHRGGGPPPPAVGDYAKRRFLRIYPAYWLVMTVLLIVPGLPTVDYGHVWPMYALVHTLPVSSGPLCSQKIFSCGLAQTWSLVAEVTFYVTLPMYVVVTERATRGLGRRGWLAAQALTLSLLSAASLGVAFSGSPLPWIGLTVIGNVFWFALGMGVALASAATEQAPAGRRIAAWVSRWSLGFWGLALASYILLCAWLAPSPFLFDRTQRVVAYLAFGVIALLLLIPVIFGDQARALPQRILATRGVAWVGLISYGIFLWHYAVVLTLGPVSGAGSFLVLSVGTLAITTACAAVSYYVLERPLMRFKYRRLRVARR